ncbi:twin-arginine translocation signal domain-containing protein [Candidatus Latescibacterota bacterium]
MNTSYDISRRAFIKRSAATTGGVMLASGNNAQYTYARSPERPFVTCRKGRKLVGIYCSADQIINHPAYLDELQKKLGCNVIIVNHGVNYPDDIRRLTPFPKEEQWVGTGYTENDENINRCADILHSRGIDIWLYGTGHVDRGNDNSLSPVDFNGMLFRYQPEPEYALEAGGSALCFQKSSIIRWQVNSYSWICKNYDIDALYLSHHRYTIPSSYPRLFGCACEDCRKAAYRLGYNFDNMRKAMLKLQANLPRMTKDKVKQAADLGFTYTDFLQTLTDGTEIMDWLEFRAAAVSDSLSRINRAIKVATGGRCHFIVDTVNPTFSLLVGHDLKTFLGEVSDAFYPMAWVDYHYMTVVASWANALVEWVDGLDEQAALRIVYSLIGWDDIDLPRNRIANLHIGVTRKEHSPEEFYRYFTKYLNGLMTHEYRRGALLNVNNLPSYQTVFPHYWGQKITEPLMDEIMDAGHDGYIFEISPEPFVKRPEKG